MAATRVTLLLFFSFAVTLHINEACFTNIPRIRLSQRMKTFTKTEAEVYHMEMDVRKDGNIVFSDGSSLKTTDGDNTVIIAGDALNSGYLDESNKHARFRDITGFHQIDHHRIIVADKQNHCLRQVDRQTGVTTTIAGKCGTAGYQDGADARFYYPNGVYNVIGPYTNQSLKEKLDKPEHKGILITDEGNMAVRLIRDGREVKTLVRSPHLRGLTSLQIMATSEAGDVMFFVTTAEGVFAYKDAKTLEQIDTASGLGGIPLDPIYPIRQFVFADTGTADSPALTMLYLDGTNALHTSKQIQRSTTNEEKETCSGQKGSVDWDTDTCQLDQPQSLLVSKESLFIGQQKAIRLIPAEGSPKDVPSGKLLAPRSSHQTSYTWTVLAVCLAKCSNGTARTVYEFIVVDFDSIRQQSVEGGVKRIVAFQAKYKLDCSMFSDKPSQDALVNVMEQNYQSLEKLSSGGGIPGLHRPTSSTKADIQCSNGLMRVRWVTSIIYNGDITEVPAQLKADLTKRLVNTKLRLSAIVIYHFPPIVSPEVASSGAKADIVLTSICDKGFTFDSATNSCYHKLPFHSN